MPLSSSRSAFEAWYVAYAVAKPSFVRAARKGASYENEYLALSWAAWQAARVLHEEEGL